MKRSNSILDPPRGKRARTVVPTTSAKSDESSRRRAGRVGNGTESPSSKNEAFHVRPIVTTIVSNACERSYWLPETTLMERYEIPVPKWTASLSSEWNKARRLLEAKLASDSLSFTSEQVDHHPKPFDSVQIKRFYCLHLPPCYDGRLQPVESLFAIEKMKSPIPNLLFFFKTQAFLEKLMGEINVHILIVEDIMLKDASSHVGSWKQQSQPQLTLET
jgi:hypothetical protein